MERNKEIYRSPSDKGISELSFMQAMKRGSEKKHSTIECMTLDKLNKIRQELGKPPIKEENTNSESTKQPLESPIAPDKHIDSPTEGKKLKTTDSALWNLETKKREYKKQVKEEKEKLAEVQYSLGSKEKVKKHLFYKFETDELKLIPFGDWHLGADNCQVEKIKGTIDYIKKTDSKVILMGDLLENATRTSVGSGIYDQRLTPMKQMEDVYKMLLPIKDNILVSLCGNHEWRCYKESGFNPAIILADRLGVPYGGFKTFIEIKVNKYKYVIYATHGSTGARLPWTRMKAVDDVARHVNAHVILYAHTHDIFAHPLYEEGIRNSKKMEVLTGGFLGDSPYGYAAMKNLPPMKTGVVKLKLFGDRWDIHASD